MTLFSLPETAQEVFDIVAGHLLTQNAKSIESDKPYCLYRSRDGKKCAAGCLIPDAHYNPDMEGYNWIELIDNYSFPKDYEMLIPSLQSIHDGHPPSEWKKQLKSLANDYELDSGVLENF